MKTGFVLGVACFLGLMAGCNAKQEEMERALAEQKARMATSTDSLNHVIAQRDKYFEDVVRAINDVYSSLEQVREKEKVISQQAGEAEGKYSLTNDQARESLLNEINGIGTTLSDNRKKIASLQSKVKAMKKESASLNQTIENLKKTLDDQEKAIAMLSTRITGLENDVAEKGRMIAQRDSIIGSQETSMNTVYVVTGTRAELEEKGIIKDEGGFPWGLFGSTTVLGSGMNQSYFERFDKTRESEININGSVDEIVPKRDETYYAMDQSDDATSHLKIIDPGRFWQERYLVIITD